MSLFTSRPHTCTGTRTIDALCNCARVLCTWLCTAVQALCTPVHVLPVHVPVHVRDVHRLRRTPKPSHCEGYSPWVNVTLRAYTRRTTNFLQESRHGHGTNRGNASWQSLASAQRRRGPARTEASLQLEATIREALNRFDDATVAGCWIDFAKGEPLWIGPATIVEDDHA